MAQSMKDIKRRISSVGNIMQITNAMELVSSAKLRKTRGRLEKTRPYYNTVYSNINDLLSLTRDNESVFLRKREVKKRAVIVCASDRGLAGGYNINVCKEAVKFKEDGVETKFYSTGTRAVEILKRLSCDVSSEFTYFDEEPETDDAYELSSFLLKEYEEEKIDELIIVFTQFKSVINLVPTSLKLLPASGFKESAQEDSNLYIEYEPSPTAVLTQMIRQYVSVSIYGSLLEAATSEQASRRIAMENATDNGKEILDKLELSYNRARQASITQEISEIVGGAEALK